MTDPLQRSAWLLTSALRRALLVGGAGLGAGLLLGEPVLCVLVAPFALCAVLGLLGRPTRDPGLSTRLDHASLVEGQGTTSRLRIQEPDGVEHVHRVVDRVAHVATRPADGRVSRFLRDGPADVELSPRRWGRRSLGSGLVALTSSWAGYRWGPVTVLGGEIRVLPSTAAYGSRAEAPQPRGLVGAHRAARSGSGSEFAGIRPFEVGDRLRRINWRVSARTGHLHVTTTRAEQDAGILLVVDATSDHGRSGGIDGAPSSLDLTVRAAASIAEHAIRQGDRVALRVISGDGARLAFGTGPRHLRRLLGTLAGIRPSRLAEGEERALRPTAQEGTMVVVLSPLLGAGVGTVAAAFVHRGLPTLVVDTLPAGDTQRGTGQDALVSGLAWRLRLLEREQEVRALVARGCPVVTWRGPGTLDDVLRRLHRQATLPKVVWR